MKQFFLIISTRNYISPALSPHRTSSIASTLETANWDLESVTVLPTAEKSLSDWAELAEMEKKTTCHCC